MSLRLDWLSLTNFRCFAECDTHFHPRLTVFVGDNGRGKTTLLEAATLVSAEFVDALTGRRQSPRIKKRDIRLELEDEWRTKRSRAATLTAAGAVAGAEVSWSLNLTRQSQPDGGVEPRRSLRRDDSLTNLHSLAMSIREQVACAPANSAYPVLPVVAYYPSSRQTQEAHSADRRRARRAGESLEGRFSGYRSFLDPLSERIHFDKWYYQTWKGVEGGSSFAALQLRAQIELLTAVRGAVASVLAAIAEGVVIDWNETHMSVEAQIPGRVPLPLSMLSTGVRNTIALVADLAHRCARLNPALGIDAARRTPGVVMIDEVDLHLHPGWQQQVVERLQVAFPEVQFILTTHSPQVLTTVPVHSIRTIHMPDGVATVRTPQFQTRGVESADVLAAIMGVDPVPSVEEARWLNRYREMIQDGTHDSDEGLSLRWRLLSHFGPSHPLMIDCDRLIRFAAIRRRPGGGGRPCDD